MIVDNDLSLKSIQHYGECHQLLKTIEELLELAAEISYSIEGRSIQSEYQLKQLRDNLSVGLKFTRKMCSKDTQLDRDMTYEDWMCMLMEVADVLIATNHAANVTKHPEKLQEYVRMKEERLREMMSAEVVA